MTTRQQRRAQERRPDQPSGRYAPDFVEGVAILNRLDPIRLRMALAALQGIEGLSPGQLALAVSGDSDPLAFRG